MGDFHTLDHNFKCCAAETPFSCLDQLTAMTMAYEENIILFHNCSNPASQLKKKSNSIAFHYVRERCAAGVCSVTYVPTEDNVADMFTKSQPGPVRKRLAEMVLF